MRGIRFFLHNAELEKDWYFSHEHWDSWFYPDPATTTPYFVVETLAKGLVQ